MKLSISYERAVEMILSRPRHLRRHLLQARPRSAYRAPGEASPAEIANQIPDDAPVAWKEIRPLVARLVLFCFAEGVISGPCFLHWYIDGDSFWIPCLFIHGLFAVVGLFSWAMSVVFPNSRGW